MEPVLDSTGTAGNSSCCASAASLVKVEARLEELSNQMKEVKTEIHSTVVDAFGSAMAVQERKGSASATAPSLQLSELYLPHPSLLPMLAEFFGDSEARFKTPQQAEALEVVLSRTRHLLLVGPTAMGKSLVYMLPARLIHPQKVTCVLLPLSALHQDFFRRCGQLGIECSRWTPMLDPPPKTTIVFVSPEHAVTAKFLNYLIHLHHLKLLVRLVIDEAHLVMLHSDFRFCFASLKPLVSSGENQTYHDDRRG